MRKICPTCKQSINPDSVAKHIFHSVEVVSSLQEVVDNAHKGIASVAYSPRLTNSLKVETPEERKKRLSDHCEDL